MRNFKSPTKADRESTFAKLRFLSTVIGQMGSMLDDGIMDDEDFFAIARFLDDIAEEVYPEHFASKEPVA